MSVRLSQALLVVACLSACEAFVLNEAINGSTGVALTVSPISATVGANATIPFEVTGGQPPYEYAVSAGGGEIHSSQASGFSYRAAAVADVGRFKFAGYFAWLLWLFVHIMYLVGFANRVLVLVQWGHSYLTRGRGARVIREPVDEG